LILILETDATLVTVLAISVALKSVCLSQRFIPLLYLKGFPLINFISGSNFLGADHFPLALFELVVLVTFLEEHSSDLCTLPPQFQKVVFTTKPESWMVTEEFQDPF